MGPVETATMSFGQGLTATPLQMAAAYATIANGGTWYRPHVLKRVVAPEGGQTVLEAPPSGRRVIAPELAATMRSMLHAVTQKSGSAEKLSLPGYLFAGKTGTAQKVDPATRRYSTDKWASSFVGFAPLDHPRLLVFVMVDEPQGTHYGSMVAGPVWQELMVDALRWLGVPPTEPLRSVAEAEPKKATKVAAVASIEDVEDAPLEPESPDSIAPQPVVEDFADVRPRREVPDFAGMSVAEALQAARRAGVRLEVVGSGRATAQSPGPGALRRGNLCKVSFTPPG
jgi:cell division protein FtsI (penicillin-binding protein 3)